MRIAVDFDGTIVEHKYPSIGRERPGAIDYLRKLSADGHKIILWTVREGECLNEAVKFCSDRGLKFYSVNSETPGDWSKEGPRKIRADVFIDDSNLGGIPDWDLLYKMITSNKTWGDLLYSGGHHKRRGPIGRLIDRCRRARRKLRGGGGHSTSRPVSHHW